MADNCYLCQLCPVVTTSGKVAKMVGSEKLCYGVESGGAFVTRAVPVFTVAARQVWDMCNWHGYNADREGNLLYTDKIETLAQGKFAVVGIFSYYGGVFSTPEIFYSGTKQDVVSYCSTLFVGGEETVMRHGIVYQIEVWRLVADESHMLPDLLRGESEYSKRFRENLYTKQTVKCDCSCGNVCVYRVMAQKAFSDNQYESYESDEERALLKVQQLRNLGFDNIAVDYGVDAYDEDGEPLWKQYYEVLWYRSVSTTQLIESAGEPICF